MKSNGLSEAAQVAALKIGESYSRTVFIPAEKLDPELIKKAKRDLLHTLSPVVARAREREPLNLYRTHTVHSFTRDYDVIVTAVIVRTSDL